MARGHFWQYIVNEEGQSIDAATVNVYLSGSSTPAYVYTTEAGGSATNTLPQATTDDEGYFEFWIGDPNESNGYVSTQKYSVTWEKPGTLSSGTISNIECYAPPRETYEVDQTDTDTVKNKTVSNNQARLWTENLTRTVSFSITAGSWSVDAAPSAGIAEVYNHTQSSPAASWDVVHSLGVQDVAVYCVDNFHTSLTFSSVNFVDENSLTISLSGSTAGTAIIVGKNNFKYYYDLTHNLGTLYPLIQVYNTTTGRLIPFTMDVASANDVRIWISSNVPATVVAFG